MSREFTISTSSEPRDFEIIEGGDTRTFTISEGVGPTGATGADGADGTSIEIIVKSASFTAANDQQYNCVATLTVTDPTPTEGKGFVVFVRNGTSTIGGTAYDRAGTRVERIYHSGAWANYPTYSPVTSADISDFNAAALAATAPIAIVKNNPVGIPIRQYFNSFSQYDSSNAVPEVFVSSPIATSYGLIKSPTSLAPDSSAFKLPNIITASTPYRFPTISVRNGVSGISAATLEQKTTGIVAASFNLNVTGVFFFLEIPMVMKCPSNLIGVAGKTISSDTVALVVCNTTNSTRKLCIYCHGSGDDVYSHLSSPNANTTMDLISSSLQSLLNDGYDILSFNGGAITANWGNQASLDALNAALAWLDDNSMYYSKVVVLGQSMGGTVGLNALRTISSISHFYGYFPVCDLQAMYNDQAWAQAAMRTAWGVADGAAFAAAVTSSGLNPVVATLSTYSGKKVRCTGSPSDTTVITASQTDALITYITGTATIASKLTTTGAHGDPSNYVPADLMSFYNS